MAIRKRNTTKKNGTKELLKDPGFQKSLEEIEFLNHRISILTQREDYLNTENAKLKGENLFLRDQWDNHNLRRETVDYNQRRETIDAGILHESGLGSMPSNPSQQQFSTGAVRRKTEPCRLDLVTLEILEANGHRLHFGATIRGYGERNWEKGIPYSNLIQHAITHGAKFAAAFPPSPPFDLTKPLPWLNQQNESGSDTVYGDACAALWNWGAIVTFLRRGNPAEEK